jgi:hypothetical protein
MLTSVYPTAELRNLSDDVLRALAAFVPLPSMLALLQSSRRMQLLLRRQLSRCLDYLFAGTHLMSDTNPSLTYLELVYTFCDASSRLWSDSLTQS